MLLFSICFLILIQFTFANQNYFKHSGYFNVDKSVDANLFYWFFENQNETAPIIVFINGGPGCSSVVFSLYESGPLMVDGKDVVENPFSFAKFSHLLYIDSPIGTGLSYGNVFRTKESEIALDFTNALIQFFELFPTLQNNDLWLVAESYGGKYAPYIAETFLKHRFGSMLKGVAIGNGLVDPLHQSSSWSAYAYNAGIVDKQQASKVAVMERQLVALLENNQFTQANALNQQILVALLTEGAWFSPTFITQYGFPELSVGEAWLQANRHHLRVSNKVPKINSACNDDVAAALANDTMTSVADKYATLLDVYDLKVLIFNGNMDFTIPTTSVESWLNALKWSGQAQFLKSKRTFWRTAPKDPFAVGGYVKKSKQLTFVSVPNAGHQVCGDRREAASQMIEYWVNYKDLPSGTPFPP